MTNSINQGGDEPTLQKVAANTLQSAAAGVGKTFNFWAVVGKAVLTVPFTITAGALYDGKVREEAASTLAIQFDFLGRKEEKERTFITQRIVTDRTNRTGEAVLQSSKESIEHQKIDGLPSQGTVTLKGTTKRTEDITTTATSQVNTNAPCLNGQYLYARTEGRNLEPAKFRVADLNVATSCIQSKYATELKEQGVNMPDIAKTYIGHNTVFWWVATGIVAVVAWNAWGVHRERKQEEQKIVALEKARELNAERE
jgi:hypothetical protein